ncbi:GDSL-type esterase/lipase family protein [Niallia sp. Krafla_26]|uniref:GDSL-type esterase/lipase family protein n=1 Tax=Niallia sp. Krafla_26 TaxID=3064703 RepID=UPI003D174E2C
MNKKKRNISLLLLSISLLFTTFYFINDEKEVKSENLTLYEKINTGKDIHYLIIGDSIGRGAGVKVRSFTWFNQWEKLMKHHYNLNLTRHSIVQSGATTFEGLYLFNRENNQRPADLIFLIFGENDRKYMNVHQFSLFYESLLSKAKQVYPNAEIITITESCLTNESFADVIKQLSAQYQTKHVDMRIPFQQSNYSAEQLTIDLVHPNQKGYQLYAEELVKVIKPETYKGQKPSIDQSIQPLTFKELSSYKRKDHSFIQRNNDFVSNEPGSSITYSFSGKHLGVKVWVGKNQGDIDVFIDQQYIRTISTNWPIEKYRGLYIESNLSEGDHEVKFVYSKKNSTKYKKKTNIQISSIIIAN